MADAAEYLEPSPQSARQQWKAIAHRSDAPSGRQVVFSPVETIMCLAAGFLVDHSKFGSSSAPRAPFPVPQLAALFHRPNSSILAKMANLDGSRSHGGRHDLDVTRHLLGTPGLLAHIYCRLLDAARDVGIGPEELPDFLGLEATAGDLLGQDELDHNEVETSVQEQSRSLATVSGLESRVTEQLLVAKARVGQHVFAGAVLRNHGHRCGFCGLAVTAGGVRARRMLVASHIKPWRASTTEERLDPANGLAACPTHDVAFDTGLITVNGGLRIHVKPEQVHAARQDPAVAAVFGRPPLRDRIVLPPGATLPGGAYLQWHHQNIYRAELSP
ncbi:HNH endonuclease [Hamadaea sp. NPDC051192]|uniref:HNH endonuclease n=1 Tax=Hamadaea sp. NPDC051192 TaxID=3154940 RepID=UPI00342642CE